MAKSPKKKQVNDYTISLTIGGKTYTGTGASPSEALGSLERPAKLMGKGVVVVTEGGRSKQMLLNPPQLKRLFYNSPGIQLVKAKQLFMLMK